MSNTDPVVLPPIALEYLFQQQFLVPDNSVKNVQESPIPAEITPEPEKPLLFLGGNEQKITIINADEHHKYISDAALTALEKILERSQLSMQDVAIVNIFGQELTMQYIQNQLQPRKCWLWNIESKQLHIPFVIPNNKVFAHGGIQYLFTDSLDSVLGNSAEILQAKTILWNAWKSLVTT